MDVYMYLTGNKIKNNTTVEHLLIALLMGLITGYLLMCLSPCCGSTRALLRVSR